MSTYVKTGTLIEKLSNEKNKYPSWGSYNQGVRHGFKSALKIINKTSCKENQAKWINNPNKLSKYTYICSKCKSPAYLYISNLITGKIKYERFTPHCCQCGREMTNYKELVQAQNMRYDDENKN